MGNLYRLFLVIPLNGERQEKGIRIWLSYEPYLIYAVLNWSEKAGGELY